MSDRLPEIEARMEHPCDKWNVVFARSDRAYLVEEVHRLRSKLDQVGREKEAPSHVQVQASAAK